MADSPHIAIIVAVGENGVIGSDGALPWRLSTDLKRFRALTLGKPVIMGRKTFQSIGKPLDGRATIIVSRDRELAVPGALVARDLDHALVLARGWLSEHGGTEVMVAGGADIYRLALPVATRIYLSRVEASPAGDATFPTLDPGHWRETSRSAHVAGPRDDHAHTFIILERC